MVLRKDGDGVMFFFVKDATALEYNAVGFSADRSVQMVYDNYSSASALSLHVRTTAPTTKLTILHPGISPSSAAVAAGQDISASASDGAMDLMLGTPNYRRISIVYNKGDVPDAPTGVTVEPGMGQITVRWEPVEGASRYRIKRSAIPGGPYAIMDEADGTSYTDTRVSDGMNYHYTVYAANANGESAPSNEAMATPVVTVPVAPTNFTLVHHVDETRDEDLLWPSWKGSADAKYYTIKKVMNPERTAFATIETNVHHPTEGFLRPDLEGEYVVCAVNDAGESPPSNPATVNGPAYPGVPEAGPSSVPMDPLPALEITPAPKPVYGPYRRHELSDGRDAYVRDGDAADTNFGTGDFLDVCGSDVPGKACRALIRFAIDRGRVPEPDIERATLKVYCKATNGPASITLYAVDDDWKETLVTWNTQPTGTPLATLTIDKAEQWNTIDVTEYVRAQHHGDKIVSFMLAADSSNDILTEFGSKEGDRFGRKNPFLRPVLEVLGTGS